MIKIKKPSVIKQTGYKSLIKPSSENDNEELINDLRNISSANETERWNFVLKHFDIVAKCIFGKFYKNTDEFLSEGTRALFDATGKWEYCKLESEEINVKRFCAYSYKYITGYVYKYMFFLKSQLTYPAFDERTQNPIEVSIEKLLEDSGSKFETEIKRFEDLGANFNAMFISNLVSGVINSQNDEIALTDVQKKYIETLQEANFNNSETDRLLKKRNAKSCCGLVASKICKFIALNPDKEDFFLNICNDQAKTYYKKVRASFLTKLIANDVKVEKKLNSKKIVFSDIHRDKIIDAVKRTAQKNIKVYQILDPQGNMHKTTEGLEKFCNDNNLCARNLLNVLKGKSKHHHGWQAAESIFQSKKTITVYNLISPDGTRYETTKGLSDFCKNHGLSYDKMLMVTKNRRPHHKGWKFCEGYEIIPKLD